METVFSLGGGRGGGDCRRQGWPQRECRACLLGLVAAAPLRQKAAGETGGGWVAAAAGRGRPRRGASWSFWTRLASSRLTWRFCAPGWSCCVRSSCTRCVVTRLTQHRGCRGPASSPSTRWRTSLMQLKFQQSKVFGCLKFSSFRSAENRWFPLRLVVDVPMSSSTPVSCANCTENRRDPQVQSSVPVEVPQIRS